MLDYQRIIDDVRAAMATTSDLTADEVLRQPAGDYAAACIEANERLRQCGSLLNQGLRSEAIHLAEIEPNLLDVVAALDFPERPAWDRMLQECGIKTAPRLNLEVAGELNEAYAQEQPLAVLLQRHRLLALAQGTLRSRIEVLRQLADVDPQNLVWEEDLLAFEQERFKQIQHEAADAAKARDVTTVHALLDELENTPWRESPAEALTPWVRQWAAKLHGERAISNLQRIEPRLNEAFSSLDVEAGRKLREAWMTHVQSLSPGDALHERVAPALQWLAEEDQAEALLREHQQYRAALEKALDEERPAADLERLYHAAVRHGHDLPLELAQRYHRRLEDIELAARRKTRLIFVCVVGVLLLAASLVGLYAYSTMHAKAVAAAAASVDRLLTDDKLDEARDYIDRLESNAPAVARAPEVQAARARLEGLERDEKERQAKAAHLLGLIESGMPTPEPSLLADVRKIAKRENERSKLAALESQLAGQDRAERKKQEAAFSKEFDAAAKQLDDLKPERFATAAEYGRALASLRTTIDTLVQRYPKIGPELRSQTQVVVDRIKQLQEAIQGQADAEKREAAVDRTVGDPTAFRNALRELARQEANTVRAADIQRALPEAPLWDAWKAFDEWLDGFGAMPPAAAAASLQSLMQKHSKYPADESLREWHAALAAIAQRNAGGKPPADSLKSLFQDALIARCWIVVDTKKKRYYVDKKPEFPEGGPAQFQHFTDFTFKKTGKGLLRGELAFQGKSPQMEIAEKVNPLLEALTADNWDQTMGSVVEAISHTKTETPIDPILKRSLLKRTVETASQGSTAFEKVFARYKRVFDASQIAESANWMELKGDEIPRLREDAEKELEKLPDPTTLVAALATEARRLAEAKPQKVKWVGWMRRTAAGGWRYWPGEPPVRSATLTVLRDSASGGRAAWETIGQVQDGKLEQTAAISVTHIEGRPVFAVEK